MPDLMYVWVGEIMRSPKVRQALVAVADRYASRLNAITASDPKENGVVVRTGGTRPKGRPYESVAIRSARRLTAQQEIDQVLGGSSAQTAARSNIIARSPRA